MGVEFVQIKCPGCGAAVSTKDEFCEYCGKPVMITMSLTLAKSRNRKHL